MKLNRNHIFIVLSIAVLSALLLGKTRVSYRGLERIKKFESFSAIPYKDAAGKWTIGYGHLITEKDNFPPNIKITREQGNKLFLRDISIVDNCIKRNVSVQLSTNEYDAIASLIFNIGCGAFTRSTLLKWLNHNDRIKAANEFPRWIYAGGRQNAGLMKRRLQEKEIFMA